MFDLRHIKKYFTITLVIYTFTLCFAPLCRAFYATVTKVSDGDTLSVKKQNGQSVKIRLYGIDCPEFGQAYGDAAAKFTSKTVLNKAVNVQSVETDQYGRMVAIVTLKNDSVSINELLARNGYAWYYAYFCKSGAFCNRLERAENSARKQKLGLWADARPVPPWDFRKIPEDKNEEPDGLLKMLSNLAKRLAGFLKAVNQLLSD